MGKTALIILGVVVLIVVIIGAVAFGSYNTLVTKQQTVKAQWSLVENQMQRRADLIPNIVSTVKGVAGLEERVFTRIAEARVHFARAFALRPDFLEAELAWCMAELPALYENESEIAGRRDAYAGRLAKLCADVESARAPAALAVAIGSHQPFYLPYQGFDDRELQTRYGQLVCKIMAARYPTPVLPTAPGPGEPVGLGIVSGFFRQHSNWKIPIKGWLKMLDRDRFRVSGYHTSADRDGEIGHGLR